jgi:hypothetical protein
VLGRAYVDVDVTGGGGFGSDWAILPTGTFVAEGEAPPDVPRLDLGSTELVPDDELGAAKLVLRWEADRPVRTMSTLAPRLDESALCGDPVRDPGETELATSGEIEYVVRCPATEYALSITLTDEDGAATTYGAGSNAALHPSPPEYLWNGTTSTEPLPVFVDWEMATRVTGGASWRPLHRNLQRDLVDVESSFSLAQGAYEFRERRSSWKGRAACGHISDYDTQSDEPVRLEVGSTMPVRVRASMWEWHRCDLVGGAVGEAKGVDWGCSPLFADTELWHRRMNIWDLIERGPMEARATNPLSTCGGGSTSSNFTVHVVTTVRLQDPAYEPFVGSG